MATFDCKESRLKLIVKNKSLVQWVQMFVLALMFPLLGSAQHEPLISIPFLEHAPHIDGDLSDWQRSAFDSGVWDLDRVRRSDWYEPKRNRLVRDQGEDTNAVDLQARYYLAWDHDFLYLGAEVIDNVNDVMDSNHEPKRWFYKDAIALFIEAPRDTAAERFGEGDHAFAFVIDDTRPDYGAWWRHGTKAVSYIEEPLPNDKHAYALRFDRDGADYTIEARIDRRLMSDGGMEWKAGETIGLMLVHCDPDGGEYGGHLLIYGKGDNDATWSEAELTRE